MDRLLNGAKLPKMDTLKADFQKLVADKKAAYRDLPFSGKPKKDVITLHIPLTNKKNRHIMISMTINKIIVTNFNKEDLKCQKHLVNMNARS